MVDSCTPSTQDIGLFHELCQNMSDIFDDEFDRNDEFMGIMKEYGFHDFDRDTLGATRVMGG